MVISMDESRIRSLAVLRGTYFLDFTATADVAYRYRWRLGIDTLPSGDDEWDAAQTSVGSFLNCSRRVAGLCCWAYPDEMKKTKSLYHGHRFPAVVISQAVRWYFRFQLSLRDIEELLFERGIVVSYETVRRWCDKFGASFASGAKAARRKPGSSWHLDEMFVTLRGEPHWLWRAVDEHGAELDVLVQKRRDKAAAKRFLRRVLPPARRARAGSSPTSCAAMWPPRPQIPRLPRYGTCS